MKLCIPQIKLVFAKWNLNFDNWNFIFAHSWYLAHMKFHSANMEFHLVHTEFYLANTEFHLAITKVHLAKLRFQSCSPRSRSCANEPIKVERTTFRGGMQSQGRTCEDTAVRQSWRKLQMLRKKEPWVEGLQIQERDVPHLQEGRSFEVYVQIKGQPEKIRQSKVAKVKEADSQSANRQISPRTWR